MAAPYFEFTSRPLHEMRNSPTMAAGEMAKKAELVGTTVQIMTLGDLFPKPQTDPEDGWFPHPERDEVLGWVKQLIEDASHPENQRLPAPIYALRDPARRYAYSETNGLPSLIAAAANAFSRDTGFDVTTANVCVGNGGKGALNGALCFFQPGATIFVAAPGWPTNYDMFPPGVRLVEIATADGLMRANDLKKAIQTYGEPAGVLINAPSNPTGVNYTVKEREDFFAVVKEQTKHTLVLNDDPYGKLVFDRDSKTALRRGPNEKYVFNNGREAVFRSVSKEYGLASERVGYVASKNAEMVGLLKKWNENKGGGMAVGPQLEAQAALMYGDGFIERTIETLKQKRDILFKGMNALDTAQMELPSATIYGWVDFKGLKGATVPASISETKQAYTIGSPSDMVRYLVNVAGVCGVPGVPFYAPDSPAGKDDWHMRISFCGPEKQLHDAIQQLKETEARLENVKKKDGPSPSKVSVAGRQLMKQALRKPDHVSETKSM